MYEVTKKYSNPSGKTVTVLSVVGNFVGCSITIGNETGTNVFTAQELQDGGYVEVPPVVTPVVP